MIRMLGRVGSKPHSEVLLVRPFNASARAWIATDSAPLDNGEDKKKTKRERRKKEKTTTTTALSVPQTDSDNLKGEEGSETRGDSIIPFKEEAKVLMEAPPNEVIKTEGETKEKIQVAVVEEEVKEREKVFPWKSIEWAKEQSTIFYRNIPVFIESSVRPHVDRFVGGLQESLQYVNQKLNQGDWQQLLNQNPHAKSLPLLYSLF